MRFFKTVILIIAMCCGASIKASTITDSMIHVMPVISNGSGNGTLDWRLFTYSGGEIGNDGKGFNYDNANNTLPQGSGADIQAFNESFLTSGADLKSYYELNFGVTNTGLIEIVLSLDLNETGAAAQATNGLSRLDIVLNPDSINGNPLDPYLNDIEGSDKKAGAGTQANIDQTYTGGTLASSLDGAKNLALQEQGAGQADFVIFTGIDPFALNDSDKVLFNISMDTLNSGAEEIFLSGTYSSGDVTQAIPEPTAIVLLSATGSLFIVVRRIFG